MTSIRKSSYKRDAILGALRDTYEHPTAESVYVTVRKRYPQISIGTVYRNLGILREDGYIKSIAVVNGQERYDADTSEHTHFICESCGDVIDLDAGENFDAAERLARNRGYTVSRRELIIYGKCHNCVNKDK